MGSNNNETANDLYELSEGAAGALVHALWPEGEWAQHLTCSEVERVADWIRAAVGADKAALVIQGHSLADDDPGDLHGAIGKLTRERGIGWVCKHRPDDDPEPGNRCKDCGLPITWVGPNQNDWQLGLTAP